MNTLEDSNVDLFFYDTEGFDKAFTFHNEPLCLEEDPFMEFAMSPYSSIKNTNNYFAISTPPICNPGYGGLLENKGDA